MGCPERLVGSFPFSGLVTGASAGVGLAFHPEIGRRCKALLDAGRLDFLRRHGLAGARSAYCDVELSPENWLLVAERCVPCADAVLPVVRKSPCSPVLPRKFEEGVCGCVVI